jgi:hypothetical protein
MRANRQFRVVFRGGQDFFDPQIVLVGPLENLERSQIMCFASLQNMASHQGTSSLGLRCTPDAATSKKKSCEFKTISKLTLRIRFETPLPQGASMSELISGQNKSIIFTTREYIDAPKFAAHCILLKSLPIQ